MSFDDQTLIESSAAEPSVAQDPLSFVQAAPAIEEPRDLNPPESEPIADDPGARMQEIRGRLLAQFEQWVDKMLAGEELPAGIPRDILEEAIQASGPQPDLASIQADLYTLFAGLTKLTGEVGLQGRTFRQLADAMSPLSELPGRLGRIEQAQLHTLNLLDRSAAEEAAGELPVSSGDVCSAIVDLYDRLERGLRTCDSAIESVIERKSSGGLRAWLAGSTHCDQAIASAQAIRDTAALTLSRVETILHDWGIERVGRAGEAFDPLRMTAMDVRPDPDNEPGTVLEVNRSGYALHGQLKATAEGHSISVKLGDCHAEALRSI